MAYHANGQAAGFVALANNAKLTVENCTAIISTNAPIHNSNLAGFVATGGGTTQTFKNCIAIVDFEMASGAKTPGISAFCAYAGAVSNMHFENCTAYANITNESNGSVGAFVANVGGHNGPKVYIQDCVAYGEINSVGHAGGLIGSVSGNHVPKIYITRAVSFVSLTVTGEEKYAGALVANMAKGNAGSTYEITDAYGLMAQAIGIDTSGCTNEIDYEILSSVTTLPEGLSSDVWTVGALPVISGASVSFGGSVALKVYAEYGIVLKVHAADTLFVDGKAVAYANKIVLDGKTYAQFAFDGIKMADIETKYALSLIAGIEQMEYSVFTYITNTYAEADTELQNVLVALLCYGNAAQANPTAVANAIVAIPELEAIVADYVEANYANVSLTPVQSEGLKVGFNLYGFVQPVFKVEESITKATVTVGGVTSELVTIDGYAFYYDLSMLAINEEMTVTFYEGDNVVLTASYAVANYITEGIAGDTLTDAEKTLCKALAVFADAVATYANN